MNYFKLFKSIPFLTTLIIIIFLSLNNQKEYTKLKILIWNTPESTLGTYIAVSTTTGYLLSYIITSNILKKNQINSNNKINYKASENVDNYSYFSETTNQSTYDKTLIERDINDPSPTIKASFRVIGKTNRTSDSQVNNNEYSDQENKYKSSDFSSQLDDNYNQESNDWNDDTYTNW